MVPHMPDSQHDDDALLRSMGRIRVIRAQLATRTWPHLLGLPDRERDAALDAMALRQYRGEQVLPTHRD